MRFFDLPPACILLLAACLAQESLAVRQDFPGSHRVLKAATKRSDLFKRSMRISKQYSTELSYIENENSFNSKSTFASQVRLHSKQPVLNLEDIEHHLKDVRCDNGKIKLDFVDKSSARDAFHACHEGKIITSHESCNEHGERNVYQIHDVSFTDDDSSLELSVIKTLWQDAFSNIDISFGHTTDTHLFRRHSDFAKTRGKRQTIAIPTNTSDSVSSAIFNLNSQFTNKTFTAEDFLLGLDQVVNDLVPFPPVPIEIGCKNCTTTGEISLTQGTFNIDTSQIDIVPDFLQGGDDGKEISNVITGGFFELAATNVGAHFELFAKPKASGAFEIALFTLPVVGFVIPGIGKAGAVFEPRIAVDFEISGGFELEYGVDVAVPNDSKIRLELSDLSNSAVNGFPGSTLTPLPFTANASGVDIKLGLAFKPTIPVGFEFAGKLLAEVSVSMNLPRLDARLSTNPQANCGNGSTNSTPPIPPYANRTTELTDSLPNIGPLVLVEANVSVTVDTGFSLELPLLPGPLGNFSVEANLFSTSFPLVTACAALEDAFKDMKSIIPAPPSTTYRNATITDSQTPIATPCPPYTNSTIIITKTSKVHRETSIVTPIPQGPRTSPCANSTIGISETSKVHRGTSIVTPLPENGPSTPPVKEPFYPVETYVSIGYGPVSSVSTKLAHSISSLQVDGPISSAPPVANGTSSMTSAVFEVSSLSSLVPSGTVAMSTGFLSPSNSSVSAGLVRQTSPPVFTGAASPSVDISVIRWKEAWWRIGVLGASFLFGIMAL